MHLPESGALTINSALAIIRDWVVESAIVVTFVTDLKHQLIFDGILIVSGFFALTLTFVNQAPLLPIFAGGIIGISFFGLQWILSGGRWIGTGDIILGEFLGIVLGFPNILICLALAYVAGTMIALPLLLKGSCQWKSKIAFGTFLSAAGIVTLFWGDAIREWYLQLIM